MDEQSIIKFNEFFESLYFFKNKYQYRIVHTILADHDTEIIVYDAGLENYYVQLKIQSDSYSYGQYIIGIKFVQQKEIHQTIFEKI